MVEDRVIPDPKHLLGGRGAWMHLRCFQVAKNRNSFSGAFKTSNLLSLHELENYLSNVHPERFE